VTQLRQRVERLESAETTSLHFGASANAISSFPGMVNIVAGSGVSFTPGTGTLTIAATGGVSLPREIRKDFHSVSAGDELYAYVSGPLSLTGVSILAKQSGNLVVDVRRTPIGSFPATSGDSICAAAKPTLATAQTYLDTTLTGWSTSSTEGDTLTIHVDSVTTVTDFEITLYGQSVILPLVITGHLPDATIGDMASYSYTVTGGYGTTTVTIYSGALPAGASISTAGAVSGTYTTGGSYSWVLEVEDSLGSKAYLSDSNAIAYATLSSTGALTDADIGGPVGGSITLSGGDGTYTVDASPVSGTRPAGNGLALVGAVYSDSVGSMTTEATYTWTDRFRSGDGQTLDVSNSIVVSQPITLLDDLPVSARGVLSLHKLISTATVAIRVRRSNDDAEQDIGFDGFGLDVTSMLTFTGSNSGYVTKVYDQTGNGEDAYQTTKANQPRVVNAGVFDGEMVFDGTDDSLKITSLTAGTPYLASYMCLRQPTAATTKIIFEASTNYNTADQAYLCFTQLTVPPSFAGNLISINGSNSAGSQRRNAYTNPALSWPAQVTVLYDRTLTGASEVAAYIEGVALPIGESFPTTELTGNFNNHDVYIGARAGTSLFNTCGLETIVFYNASSAAYRDEIELAIGREVGYWRTRLNAPTMFKKIDGLYFCCDIWHSRVIYTDSIYKPVSDWITLDDTRFLVGPHTIEENDDLYVMDNTENGSVITYKKTGSSFAFQQELTVGALGTRPHCVKYDSVTDAWYVLLGGGPGPGGTRKMVKLTRSGDTLSIARTDDLSFISGQYSRGFRIIDGKMYFVAVSKKIYEVAFDGSSYTLLNTYTLPTGMESPNDVFKSSSGDWYATATNQKIIKFASLAAMDAGTYTDVYASFDLAGTPYYLEEFDGALWVPEIIERNGLTKVVSGVPELVQDYGTENASSLYRHNNP